MPTQTSARGAYIHLFVVYLIWGSTFVAMRAAVMGDSGFKPFSVGASRLAVSSFLLFGWAVLRKVPLRLSRRDLWGSAVSGVIIWVTGNGFTMWAEQTVDAGYAALIFSGPELQPYLSAGIQVSLTTAWLVALIVALGSCFEFAIGGPDANARWGPNADQRSPEQPVFRVHQRRRAERGERVAGPATSPRSTTAAAPNVRNQRLGEGVSYVRPGRQSGPSSALHIVPGHVG